MMLVITTAGIPVLGTININKNQELQKSFPINNNIRKESHWTGVFIDELDQSQTVYDNYFKFTSPSYILLQSFKPSKPILTRIQLFLEPSNWSGDSVLPVYVIVSISDGSQIIAETSRILNDAGLGSTWEEFTFNNIEVNPGNTYYILLSTPHQYDMCFWGHSLTDRYSNGNAWIMENFILTSLAPYDFCFKTYGKSTEDNIIITDIKGGFGVSAVIFNNGDETIDMLGWNISFEGFVPIGGKSDGSIQYLHPDEGVTIRTGFLLGIGRGWFRVTAGDVDVDQNCFIIGPFVMLRP